VFRRTQSAGKFQKRRGGISNLKVNGKKAKKRQRGERDYFKRKLEGQEGHSLKPVRGGCRTSWHGQTEDSPIRQDQLYVHNLRRRSFHIEGKGNKIATPRIEQIPNENCH